MDSASLVWLVVIVLVAVAAAVLVWLVTDWQTGRRRAESRRAGERRRTPPPPPRQPEAAPRYVPPIPPAQPDPRISFGQQHDPAISRPASPVSFGEEVLTQPTLANRGGAQARICPLCRKEIGVHEYQEDKVVICPNCHTHVHSECWDYAGKACPQCRPV